MTTVVLDIETVGIEEHRIAIEQMAGDRDPDAYAALCPPLARVVCVCLARLNDRDEIAGEIALYDCTSPMPPLAPEGAEAHPGEAALLTRLSGILAKVGRIVTFNGSSFDIPTLLLRSMAHGVRSSVLLAAHQEYRRKPDLNYDLREQFTNYGRFRDGSLRAFCIAMGLPDPKADSNGTDVAAFVATGDAQRLIQYCRGDVRATAGLYRAWRSYARPLPKPVPAEATA